LASLRNIIRRLLKSGLKASIPRIYRLLHGWTRNSPVAPLVGEPKRILVLNGAHIGDSVITLSIIPILRSAYPHAEIGFLVGSWSSMAIAHHPNITFIHHVDHWSLNRSKECWIKKILHFRKTYKVALREIRDTKYDLALCPFPYYLPDYMDLAWRAGIPIRLGFANSLFASLATTITSLRNSPFLHQGALQAEVLRPLLLDQHHIGQRKSVLPESSEESLQEASRLLEVADIRTVRYSVVHVGAGALNREMPPVFWRDLAAALSKAQLVVFTGRGAREAAVIDNVIEGLENCISACDKLSWDGFVSTVRYADALYGVESMAGHVAAAVNTPSIVVYSGVAGVARWRPEGPLSIVFTNHLACAPCGKIRGCSDMTCLKNIAPLDLLEFHRIEQIKDIVGTSSDDGTDLTHPRSNPDAISGT
jgi:ADP-heptose:LPS heptosyltransferase